MLNKRIARLKQELDEKNKIIEEQNKSLIDLLKCELIGLLTKGEKCKSICCKTEIQKNTICCINPIRRKYYVFSNEAMKLTGAENDCNIPFTIIKDCGAKIVHTSRGMTINIEWLKFIGCFTEQEMNILHPCIYNCPKENYCQFHCVKCDRGMECNNQCAIPKCNCCNKNCY